jgi:hypothetical protein
MFHWTLLKNPSAWEKILYNTKHIAGVDRNTTKILDEDEFLMNLFILQV